LLRDLRPLNHFAYETGAGNRTTRRNNPMRRYMENYRNDELAKASIDEQTR
jgi:hypothetical protein